MNKTEKYDISQFQKAMSDADIKNIKYNCSTAKLTSIAAGGRCLCYAVAGSREKLKKIINICLVNKIKIVIIGGGTNILFNDGNLNLVLVKLGEEFNYLRLGDSNELQVGAAYSLSKFVSKTVKSGFDFSFLAGIPGTFGGSVLGNSGSNKQGICQYVKKVKCILIKNNSLVEEDINVTSNEFGYRFFSIPNLLVLTDIVLSAERSDKKIILEKIKSRIKDKKMIQPTNTKNAGCFFKNPEGSLKSAGEMIEECGLKGFAYGGARVSERHSNFIENFKKACAEDIIVLAKIVKSKVKERFNINLEYEVRIIGF